MGSLLRAIPFACVMWTIPAVSHAQYPQVPALHSTIQVDESLRRPRGFSFEVFGQPSSIAFALVVVNDSPDMIFVPPSFATNLVVRVDRAGRPVAIKTVWDGIAVALPADEAVPVGLATSFNLPSQGVARFHAVLHGTDTSAFCPGEYTVAFDMRRSVGGLRDGAGKAWRGYSGEEGSFSVVVTDPHTKDERRRAHVAAANWAMVQENPSVALTHYTEMLRSDPADVEAQYGLGVVCLDLRRYAEAAAAFEFVIAHTPRDERSPLYGEAAYAYLALGQDARAEAILTAKYGAESGKQQLARIREAVRQR